MFLLFEEAVLEMGAGRCPAETFGSDGADVCSFIVCSFLKSRTSDMLVSVAENDQEAQEHFCLFLQE
jgi:hypothetical protein